MSRIATLLRVIRPHIVVGGALGYMLGVFYPSINSRIDLGVALLGYITVFFIDLSTHYSNDLYDAERDRQANWKPFGSNNVLIKMPEIAPWLFRVAILCSAVSLFLASYLVFQNGINWTVLGLTIIGNILAWSYSHPAIHLKAKGLGEIAIASGTGFIIPAIGYLVVTGSLTWDFIKYDIPLVLYGFILSVYLEIPDIEIDKKNGINNLSVRFGHENMMKTCLLLCIFNSVYFFSGYVPFLDRWLLSIVSLFPLGGCLIGVFRRTYYRDSIERNTFIVINGLFAFIIGLNIILIFLS